MFFIEMSVFMYAFGGRVGSFEEWIFRKLIDDDVIVVLDEGFGSAVACKPA